MSRNTRTHQVKDLQPESVSMLAKVRGEISNRYVEVEADGISLARLACVYIAGAREAKLRMFDGLRSVLGLRHAH